MILSRVARSKGPLAPHLNTYLSKVGFKCGFANQLKRAVLMGPGVLQLPLLGNIGLNRLFFELEHFVDYKSP